jgi:sugar phosphate permease
MPEADQQRSTSFFGWKNALLLFFIYGAVYGFVFYGFTVVFPEMIRAQGWSRGDAAIAHTLRAFSLGALAPLVAVAIGRAGAKRIMIAGLFLGVVVLGMLGTVTSQLWHWIVLWGILMPISFSFGGAIPIQTTLTHWFDVRRATALGIVLSAAAFGGFIAAPLYTLIMRERSSVLSSSGTSPRISASSRTASTPRARPIPLAWLRRRRPGPTGRPTHGR